MALRTGGLMNICVITTTENLEAARESAKQIEEFTGHTTLAIPLSANGEYPPTHWLCSFNASDEVKDKIQAILSVSEMEIAEPRAFLKARNLKLINLKKMSKARNEL